jgi:hypothetical protein
MQSDWSDYLRVHADRRNLLIHLFAVPLFIAAFLTLLLSAMAGRWSIAIAAGAAALIAMVMQGRGHRLELKPPRPFTGPGNFLRRWFTEQFVVFPQFVFSGRWLQQYRRTESKSRHES